MEAENPEWRVVFKVDKIGTYETVLFALTLEAPTKVEAHVQALKDMRKGMGTVFSYVSPIYYTERVGQEVVDHHIMDSNDRSKLLYRRGKIIKAGIKLEPLAPIDWKKHALI
jgi:hypothetical protein